MKSDLLADKLDLALVHQRKLNATLPGMPAVRIPRPERRAPEPFPLVKRLRLEIGAPETEAMLELEKLANKWRVRSEWKVFARKAIKGEI